MEKRRLKDDLEMMCAYADELEQEIEQLKKDKQAFYDLAFDTQNRLNISNGTVSKQIDHIAMLNRMLEQQDKAIERKDAQWLGLRMAFQDALINNQV